MEYRKLSKTESCCSSRLNFPSSAQIFVKKFSLLGSLQKVSTTTEKFFNKIKSNIERALTGDTFLLSIRHNCLFSVFLLPMHHYHRKVNKVDF